MTNNMSSYFGLIDEKIRCTKNTYRVKFFFSIANVFVLFIYFRYQNLNKTYAGAVLVLCFVNLINYMDRSTVAGMIDDIKTDPSFDTG